MTGCCSGSGTDAMRGPVSQKKCVAFENTGAGASRTHPTVWQIAAPCAKIRNQAFGEQTAIRPLKLLPRCIMGKQPSDKQNLPGPTKVFITHRESVCDECGDELGSGAWIMLAGERGALCLACADLDHLAFLPSGDVAVTRRAQKHSTLAAVVLKWSRARKRYERQGILVEEQALEQAEKECLADADVRERRRRRESERRAELDQQYIEQFAACIRKLYPRCPSGRERTIAEHACLKYSGRVGRSAAAKSLSEEAVDLAVNAHIRHAETAYDRLLQRQLDRRDARASVAEEVRRIRERWGRCE
jgi:hypothetical protein